MIGVCAMIGNVGEAAGEELGGFCEMDRLMLSAMVGDADGRISVNIRTEYGFLRWEYGIMGGRRVFFSMSSCFTVCIGITD
jgi:hypothetical protein